MTALRLLSDPAEPVLLAYEYDDNGLLEKVFNSSGLPLVFSYDEQARLTRWEDRNGTWYRYEYDEAGRCVFSTGTDRALEYTYRYEPENLRTTATDSRGHSTVYEFNDSFQLIAQTDALGHTNHPPGLRSRRSAVRLHRPSRPDASRATRAEFEDMPLVSKGWAKDHAFFKGEGPDHINIGLGQGKALDLFNDSFTHFEEIPR